MKTVKPFLKFIPEIYFMSNVLFYWIMERNLTNPLAIIIAVLFILLLVWKNRIYGICLASVLIVINLYFVMALLSEFSEFPSFTDNARNLIVFGSLYLGMNLSMATIMVIKYMKMLNPKI